MKHKIGGGAFSALGIVLHPAELNGPFKKQIVPKLNNVSDKHYVVFIR
jgi:hypothetical protein